MERTPSPAGVAVLARGGAHRYRLTQSFRYDYDAPVTDLLHRLVVLPTQVHGDQRLVHGSLAVSDPRARVSWLTGAFGSRTAVVRLDEVPAHLELSVAFTVERAPVLVPAPVPVDPRLLRATALTRPDAALRATARAYAAAGSPLDVAAALCTAVHQRIAYTPGATGVRTTAAQAWELRAGVCQDQAHAMLALCRYLGIAARYVSGHLVGQGGTHAWVEVLTGERAVVFDPCHDRQGAGPADGYVTVAVGRDYTDVPPTSGWYSGPAVGRLSGSRELVRAD